MSLNLCPECGHRYSEKITGSKATEPVGGKLCHHGVEFEGDSNTGVWYLHESDPAEGGRYE